MAKINCYSCKGKGTITCNEGNGNYEKMCYQCNGTGKQNN